MRNPTCSTAAKVTNKKKSTGNSNANGNGSSTMTSTTTTTPCCSKVGLKRGPWTPEEDEVLADYIRKEGEGRWRTLPKRAGLLRCGKSCRLRWMNYLRPSVKRGQIAPDEEDLILRLHRLLGNRWSLIAGRIPGRTDNEIKNYWNTHLSKKLISQGIDPRTHKPLNPPTSSTTTPPPPIIITNHHQIPNSITTTTHHHHHHGINIITSVNQEFDPKSTSQTAVHENSNNNMIVAYENFNIQEAAGDDVSAMDHLLGAQDNYDDDMNINYCADDVFSSFLNSLINEDAFASQRHVVQSEQPPNDNDPLISSAAALPPAPGYGLGVVWESPLMSATFSQNDDPNPNRVVDHHE